MEKHTVVIGAGLTGLTTAFHLVRKGVDVLLLEQTDRTGGQIRSFREEGFVFESGPNTGIISYPEVAELFAALAPACCLDTANEEAKRRLIWKGDRFHTLPSGLFSAVTTPLFSLTDKFRVLGEPFRPKGQDPEESVGALAVRRLGKTFLQYAVDPFLSGVYAGDPMQLVTKYALPKLYNLEQDYGSFIRGAIAKAKLPKTERDRLATKQVFSAAGGLQRLTDALTDAIGEARIRVSAKQIRIEPSGQKWQVSYQSPEGSQTLYADRIVTTVGGYGLPDLLPFVPHEEMRAISELHYAPVVQVSVGIRNTGNLKFNAFGGLVPSTENREVLGILFPSACFDGRAPEGGALFSFFMGGVKHPEMIHHTDQMFESFISRELHDMLKFPKGTTPDLLRVFRHTHAIPQYGQSSGLRFRTIEMLEQRYPGLILAGNIRGGIGMADRIRQATAIADQLTDKK